MFGREMKDTRVAGLADGELSAEQAQVLAQRLHQDSAMQAELHEQRVVKEALGVLPQYSAPDFMATRIMGEIASRRNAPAKRTWRPAFAWSAGAATFLLSFGAAIGLWPQFAAQQSATMLADSQPSMMIPAGLVQNMEYDARPWDSVAMPEGVTDPKLKSFLTFANTAHQYRKLQHASEGTSPDMPQVMVAMDQSPDAPVVWATDSR
jgi:hypothetical protein